VAVANQSDFASNVTHTPHVAGPSQLLMVARLECRLLTSQFMLEISKQIVYCMQAIECQWNIWGADFHHSFCQ